MYTRVLQFAADSHSTGPNQSHDCSRKNSLDPFHNVHDQFVDVSHVHPSKSASSVPFIFSRKRRSSVLQPWPYDFERFALSFLVCSYKINIALIAKPCFVFRFYHLPVRHLSVFICVFITKSLAAGHCWVVDIILLSEFGQMFLVVSKFIVSPLMIHWHFSLVFAGSLESHCSNIRSPLALK